MELELGARFFTHCQGKITCPIKATSFYSLHPNLHTHIHKHTHTHTYLFFCCLLEFFLSKRRGRQPVFLTLSPSQALISFTFSNVPVRSSLIESEKTGSFVLYSSLPVGQWLRAKRLLQPILPSITMQKL